MIIISPAKKLNISSENFNFKITKPLFFKKTTKLVKLLKKLKFDELKMLMNVSDSLAKLNFQRFKEFDTNLNESIKPAVFLFSGDTFNGLSIRNIDENLFDYVQDNLRILSGLYGILKPFDNVQPYRLEMGTNTNLLMNHSLYDFWSDEITENLKQDLRKNNSKFLFNLSSNEYFKSICPEKLDFKIINFDFKKKVGNKLTNIGMMIKKCRGMMAKFLLEKKVKNLEDIHEFNQFGFKLDNFDKRKNTFLFIN